MIFYGNKLHVVNRGITSTAMSSDSERCVLVTGISLLFVVSISSFIVINTAMHCDALTTHSTFASNCTCHELSDGTVSVEVSPPVVSGAGFSRYITSSVSRDSVKEVCTKPGQAQPCFANVCYEWNSFEDSRHGYTADCYYLCLWRYPGISREPHVGYSKHLMDFLDFVSAISLMIAFLSFCYIPSKCGKSKSKSKSKRGQPVIHSHAEENEHLNTEPAPSYTESIARAPPPGHKAYAWSPPEPPV